MVGGTTEFRTSTISSNPGQRLEMWGIGRGQSGFMLPLLTKSMRLMRHSCGISCIWKNIWRMLEMLMQARTALGQRRQADHPSVLEYSHPSQPPIPPLFLTLGR